MSRAFVAAGRRLNFTATVAYKAGDLAAFNGFFGTIQDDVLVGRLAVLILDAGVNDLKNYYGTNIAMGTKVYAIPTTTVPAGSQATTLQIFPAASIPSTNYVPIGRVWATGPASAATGYLRVNLFHSNAY